MKYLQGDVQGENILISRWQRLKRHLRFLHRTIPFQHWLNRGVATFEPSRIISADFTLTLHETIDERLLLIAD